MYIRLPEYVWGARGSLWNLPRFDRMGRAATFPLVPAVSKCFMNICSVLRKNSGDGDTVPAMENPMSFPLLEVGVKIPDQTPMRMFHYLCAFLGFIFSVLLALMGLLLQVFSRRTNDNELAASPGPPLTAASHSVPAFPQKSLLPPRIQPRCLLSPFGCLLQWRSEQ